VLRYAARCMDLLEEIGEPPPVEEFLAILSRGVSNDPREGNGRDIWERHVVPTRVDAERVVAHLALLRVLERKEPAAPIGPFDVLSHEGALVERGPIVGAGGRVTLQHRRTRRRTDHVYAVVHLGGLEVFGATRAPDPDRDDALFDQVADAVESGAAVPSVLRLLAEGVGPREFGLESALPDAAEELVASAARQLTERFGATYEHLYADHRGRLNALARAGYPLPPELRAPVEFAPARRFETEIPRAVDDPGTDSFRAARDVVREARQLGLQLASPEAALLMSRTVRAAVERALDEASDDRVNAALGLLRLTRELDLAIEVERAQELVFAALTSGRDDAGIRRLGDALGIAIRP